MEDKNTTATVTIPLSYYNELMYIKCKSELNNTVVTQLNEYTKNKLMDHYYKQDRMMQRYDTRDEMADPRNSYFGFDTCVRDIFNFLGISDIDMIQYVNMRWDIFEKEKNKNAKDN